MDYVRKLPLLMAVASALIVGMGGCAQKVSNKENMLNMLIIMVVFYIAGHFIKYMINGILEAKRIKDEEILQEQKRIEQEKNYEEMSKRQAGKTKGLSLDLVADDDLDFESTDEEFNALPVADFIKKELNL